MTSSNFKGQFDTAYENYLESLEIINDCEYGSEENILLWNRLILSSLFEIADATTRFDNNQISFIRDLPDRMESMYQSINGLRFFIQNCDKERYAVNKSKLFDNKTPAFIVELCDSWGNSIIACLEKIFDCFVSIAEDNVEAQSIAADRILDRIKLDCHITKRNITNNETDDSLNDYLKELHSLIGLDEVKNEVESIINLVKVQKKGEELGEKAEPISLHMVFLGNPGTGKTTVARLIAKIYKALGVLSSGHLVEVERKDLVEEYVGQTAKRTNRVIKKALGGILFIDEAYTLTQSDSNNDFGPEAIATIITAMENHRDDFIVIAAGYPELMKDFIASNPGLKSRFGQYIYFTDYKPDELKEIFISKCKNENIIISRECIPYLNNYFEKLYINRDENFGNGRDVRNFFEKVIKARANRLGPIIDTVTKEEYRTILLSDLTEAERMSDTYSLM